MQVETFFRAECRDNTAGIPVHRSNSNLPYPPESPGEVMPTALNYTFVQEGGETR